MGEFVVTIRSSDAWTLPDETVPCMILRRMGGAVSWNSVPFTPKAAHQFCEGDRGVLSAALRDYGHAHLEYIRDVLSMWWALGDRLDVPFASLAYGADIVIERDSTNLFIANANADEHPSTASSKLLFDAFRNSAAPSRNVMGLSIVLEETFSLLWNREPLLHNGDEIEVGLAADGYDVRLARDGRVFRPAHIRVSDEEYTVNAWHLAHELPEYLAHLA